MSIFRKAIIEILKKETNIGEEELNQLLEIPPSPELGDYAFPCFSLAKKFKKSPNEIAKELEGKITAKSPVKIIKANGAYLNFFIDTSRQAEFVLAEILEKKEEYGSGSKKGKIMVEFFHANTHKAVHIGHIRNVCLGESLSRILEFNGSEVIRVNYQGDIGPHVAKCLFGLINFKEKPPERNRTMWLGEIYMKANEKIEKNPELEIEVKEILKKIYSGEPGLVKLWKETRKWCLEEFEELYEELGVKFKRLFFESEMEFPAREISKELLKKGIAEESEGAIIINLEKYDLGIFILLTSEGTALYSSKDIALAKKKFSEYRLDKSIHVVGNEQKLHFKQLFKTFELMNFKEAAEKSLHLAYGLVMLPTGKMSSRLGNLIHYENLIQQLTELAKKEVEKRHSEWDEKRKTKTAKSIAFAALKFGMLNRDNNRDLIFDWEQALRFEGETGPYAQYAHARICSILKKYGKKIKEEKDFSVLVKKEEEKLIKMLSVFPDVVEKSANDYKLLNIVKFLLELAQALNEFYHSCPILQEKNENLRNARLNLILSVKQVLANSLYLLGIDALEEM